MTAELSRDDRDAEIAPPPEDLIPLSVISLDLDAPPGGWTDYLSARNVAVELDDIGRLAITRVDARKLLDERREAEARAAELRAKQEARLIEPDQRSRAQLPKGTPWYKAVGLSAVEAMMQAEHANRPRSVHQQLLDDALAGGGSTMVYQSFQDLGES
jgi:hypothetical protein